LHTYQQNGFTGLQALQIKKLINCDTLKQIISYILQCILFCALQHILAKLHAGI